MQTIFSSNFRASQESASAKYSHSNGHFAITSTVEMEENGENLIISIWSLKQL